MSEASKADTAAPRLGTLEWYAYHGTPLLACPRCKNLDLYGTDSDDSGHIIHCRSCGIKHHGSFGESASKEWNEGKIKPWIGDVQTFDRNQPA